MANEIEIFKEQYPSLDSYWRSIILFGRNVASYKFALAESLLEIAPTGKTVITLDELADPFSRHLCEHLKTAPKQATSQTSRFIDACKQFNSGQISHDKLSDVVARSSPLAAARFMIPSTPASMSFVFQPAIAI